MTMIDERFDDPVQFCETLWDLMQLNRVKQYQLAREAGMDRSRVNKYLRIRRRPSLETMLRLDAALTRILYQRSQRRRRPKP